MGEVTRHGTKARKTGLRIVRWGPGSARRNGAFLRRLLRRLLAATILALIAQPAVAVMKFEDYPTVAKTIFAEIHEEKTQYFRNMNVGKYALLRLGVETQGDSILAFALLEFFKNDTASIADPRNRVLNRIKEASNKGSPSAQALLGVIFEYGLFGVRPDLEKAHNYFRKAGASTRQIQPDQIVKFNHLNMLRLADFLRRHPEYMVMADEPRVITQNAERVFVTLLNTIFADTGHPEPLETPKDYDNLWKRASAERSSYTASVRLGLSEIYLTGVLKDQPDSAKKAFLLRMNVLEDAEADFKNLAELHFSIAWHYMNGTGVQADWRQAKKHWEIAADLGNNTAKLELAWHYLHATNGFERNSERALELASSLISINEPLAPRIIAIAYIEGLGVEKNDALGYAWMKISADRGEPDSIKDIKRFDKELEQEREHRTLFDKQYKRLTAAINGTES